MERVRPALARITSRTRSPERSAAEPVSTCRSPRCPTPATGHGSGARSATSTASVRRRCVARAAGRHRRRPRRAARRPARRRVDRARAAAGTETTGIAFQYDPPDASAPQAILLAVPPGGRGSRGRSGRSTGCCSRRSTSPGSAPSDPSRARRRRALPAGDVPRLQRRRRRRVLRPQPAHRRDLRPRSARCRRSPRWSRIEPQPPGDDVAAGLAARVHDPLWLLARQWQVGEFQGEDAGTPIVARWRGHVSPMTRFVAGADPDQHPAATRRASTPAGVPLETLVERQPCHSVRRPSDGLRLARRDRPPLPAPARRCSRRRAGSTDRLRHDVRRARPDRRQRAVLDAATAWRTPTLVAGRALDGRRLRAALGDPAAPRARRRHCRSPRRPRRGVEAAARRGWPGSTTLFSEPGADAGQAWQPDRMEYAFSLATRLGDDALRRAHPDGRPVRRRRRSTGTPSTSTATSTWAPARTTPARGRHAHGDPGAGDVPRHAGAAVLGARGRAHRPRRAAARAATDLPQLLLVETLTGYGNDWYVIPIELPVGSLVRVALARGHRHVRRADADLRPIGDRNLAIVATAAAACSRWRCRSTR